MSDEPSAGSRADFHREHQARAVEEAERLLARREVLQGAWLAWVGRALPDEPAAVCLYGTPRVAAPEPGMSLSCRGRARC